MERLESRPELFEKYRRETKLSERLNPGELRFTDEERGAFYKALEKFKDDKPSEIEEFIFEVERYCNLMLPLIKTRRSRSVIRKDTKPMLDNFEKTLKYLKDIQIHKERRHFNPAIVTDELRNLYRFTHSPSNLTEFSQELEEAYQFLFDIRHTANEIIGPLQQLIKLFESHQTEIPGPGHPRADSKGFVKTIYALFDRHLDAPTMYSDGPFYQVVRIALKSVGLPSKDPRKSVKAAHESYQKHPHIN